MTAADNVALADDPWWNPAVESQAIDRAHRIGQQRSSTITRMAIRGTVEERILKFQVQNAVSSKPLQKDQATLMEVLNEAGSGGFASAR